MAGGSETVLGQGLPCPPCNIGPLSTPHYTVLAGQAIHALPGGITVFAGQRAEGFYVDLGSIFDLANLRPLENLHAQYGMHVFTGPAPGVNATDHLNVHSIALQVPISELTGPGTHTADDPHAVIGVWTTASRQKVRIWDDQTFLSYVAHPELAALLPALYPGQFPHLATLASSGKSRADLIAILLTGLPSGLIPGFQNNTGNVLADMLRLNTAIPPASSPNPLGLVGGDPAGFPNGRRVFDDVVTVELRAVAGLVYPLVDPSYKPDAAVSAITDGLGPSSVSSPYLAKFPYLGLPYSGFDNPS